MLCSMFDIGKRIASLREKRGLSQKELAAALHVSREIVAKWENGSRDLKTEHTVALADYFRVTCDEMLRGVSSGNVDIHKKTGLSDKAVEMLAKLKRSYTGAATNAVINRLLENEDNYGLFQAIRVYLTGAFVPLFPQVPLETQRKQLTRLGMDVDKLLVNSDSHFYVEDLYSGTIQALNPEIINQSYLTLITIQLTKYKNDKKDGEGNATANKRNDKRRTR